MAGHGMVNKAESYEGLGIGEKIILGLISQVISLICFFT
jgi:hypothetical protein